MSTPEQDRTRTGRWFGMFPRPSTTAGLLGGGLLVLLLLVSFLARRSGPPAFHERVLLEGGGPIAFSPDGGTLATGYVGKEVRLWDVPTGELRRTLEAPGEVYALAFSPDGRMLAAGGGYKGVLLWDAGTGERLGVVGDAPVPAIAFSPDSGTLASGGEDRSDDRTVRLWDVPSRRLRRTLQEYDRGPPEGPQEAGEPGPFEWGFDVSSVAFSPDGRLLTSAHGGHLYVTIKVWEVRTGRFLRHLGGMGAGVKQVVFRPGGQILAAGCDSGKVLFWDVDGGEPLGELQVHKGPVASLAISPDVGTLATSCRQEAAALWDLRTGKQLLALDGPGRGWPGVAFSPEGKTFAAASRDGVRLWDVVRP